MRSTNGSNTLFVSRQLQIAPVTSLPGKKFKVTKLTNNLVATDNAIRVAAQHKPENKNYIVKLLSDDKQQTIYYPVIFDERISDPNLVEMGNVARAALQYAFSTELNLEFLEEAERQAINTLDIEIQKVWSIKENISIKPELLTAAIHHALKNYPLIPNQSLIIPVDDGKRCYNLEVKIKNINHIDPTQVNSATTFSLQDNSVLQYAVSERCTMVSLAEGYSQKTLSLDFTMKGIGGLKAELEHIARSGFLPRMMPSNEASKYGVKYTKGILLYGPPGTGKTLIARELAKMVAKNKVKFVNGPELFNKFLGQSEENLRAAFADAEAEFRQKGAESDLHVIIFDEIDALCKKRSGSGSGAGEDDKMVSQLLTLMDGLDSAQNVLVIGMTNRRDLIDDALLRPGRFDLKIQIGLPDEKARLEILMIKTQEMRKNGLLDASVDLTYWAHETENFTPAEIEQLVKNAFSYAIVNNFELVPDKNELTMKKGNNDASSLANITQAHFNSAILDINPAFTTDNKYKHLLAKPFAIYNEQISQAISNFKTSLNMLAKNKNVNQLTWLITGPSGTGKSRLAVELAKESGAKYIKVLSAEQFLSLPLDRQLAKLDDEFHNAKLAGFSVIILDELENLLGADANLNGYHNILRMKYQSLLKDLADGDHKCIVIATSQSKEFIERVKFDHLFNEASTLDAVKLELSNVQACNQTLTAICEALKLKVVPLKKPIPDVREMEFSIQDLIYQINKFCTGEMMTETVDLGAFCAKLLAIYNVNNETYLDADENRSSFSVKR